MEQHRTVSIDGHKVHYRDEGRKNERTVVLLHGFLQSLDVWSPYVLTYMRNYRVLTIDLPGHGLTENFSDVHTMTFMADVVKAVLEEAGVDQCVMIGHSMGGYVTMAFVEKYPYTLRGVGLVNSHALADSKEMIQARENACRHATENLPSYILGAIPPLFDESKKMALSQEIRDLQDQCLITSTEAVVAAQKGMAARKSTVAALSRLEVPTLFIFGKNDPILPIEIAVGSALVSRHAEMLVLDKVAHMSFMEERDYVKPRIANFIDTCYY